MKKMINDTGQLRSNTKNSNQRVNHTYPFPVLREILKIYFKTMKYLDVASRYE